MKKGFYVTLVLVTVLGSCTTLPAVVKPESGVRVLSYSAEKAIRLGNLNGPPEEKPGLLSSRREGYDEPLWAALDQGWDAFPTQAQAALGLASWQNPGTPSDHPAWLASSSAPLEALSFDMLRARGYYWPEGFRYLSPDTALGPVAREYPGELLLTVEFRIFTEDVGEKTDYRYQDVRLGLWTTFRLHGTDGSLLAQVQVTGRSTTVVALVGDQFDRRRLPELFVEAQADALREWARRVQFRKDK